MGSSRWKRQGSEFHDQQGYGVRSESYRRSSQEVWQSTVPSWEKEFCYYVGAVPWKKLLETKKYIYLYDRVLKWNDSAVEEAFNNAKSRYWAKINRLPCDESLPGPDIYNDDIVWPAKDDKVDLELYLDLEREPEPSNESNQEEGVVILTDNLCVDPSFKCTGWGDDEEDFKKANEAENPRGPDDAKNTWEQNWDWGNRDIKDDRQGWGNCNWGNMDVKDDDQGWGYNSNGWGNDFNQWGSNYDNSRRVYGGHGGPTGGMNSWNKDGSGCNNSRYKASRFPGNDYHADHGWKDRPGRKKRPNFANERHGARQWNVKPFSPLN